MYSVRVRVHDNHRHIPDDMPRKSCHQPRIAWIVNNNDNSENQFKLTFIIYNVLLTQVHDYNSVDTDFRTESFYKTNTDEVLGPSNLVLNTPDRIFHSLKLYKYIIKTLYQ